MNKRIRKKHLKRALIGLLAAYDEYEAAQERVFRKTLQDVTAYCVNHPKAGTVETDFGCP